MQSVHREVALVELKIVPLATNYSTAAASSSHLV